MRLLFLLLLLAPAAADADCALMGLQPKVLTVPDATLAADGGIVVGAEAVVQDGSLADGDVAVQSAWKFVGPKGSVAPTIDVLAPGLAVYRASQDVLELVDGNGKSLAKAKRSMKHDKLAAPKVKSIRWDAPMSRRQVQRVEVTLDGPPPAGVIALVLADAKGTSKSWGHVAGTVFYPYLSRDCLTLPNGTVPSKKGDKVTLAWIDASGRKSAFTKPLVIK